LTIQSDGIELPSIVLNLSNFFSSGFVLPVPQFTRLRADAPQLAAGRKREVTAPKPWRRRVSRSGGVPLDFVTDAPQLAAGSFTIVISLTPIFFASST
jgi:hypothetical protein